MATESRLRRLWTSLFPDEAKEGGDQDGVEVVFSPEIIEALKEVVEKALRDDRSVSGGPSDWYQLLSTASSIIKYVGEEVLTELVVSTWIRRRLRFEVRPNELNAALRRLGALAEVSSLCEERTFSQFRVRVDRRIEDLIRELARAQGAGNDLLKSFKSVREALAKAQGPTAVDASERTRLTKQWELAKDRYRLNISTIETLIDEFLRSSKALERLVGDDEATEDLRTFFRVLHGSIVPIVGTWGSLGKALARPVAGWLTGGLVGVGVAASAVSASKLSGLPEVLTFWRIFPVADWIGSQWLILLVVGFVAYVGLQWQLRRLIRPAHVLLEPEDWHWGRAKEFEAALLPAVGEFRKTQGASTRVKWTLWCVTLLATFVALLTATFEFHYAPKMGFALKTADNRRSCRSVVGMQALALPFFKIMYSTEDSTGLSPRGWFRVFQGDVLIEHGGGGELDCDDLLDQDRLEDDYSRAACSCCCGSSREGAWQRGIDVGTLSRAFLEATRVEHEGIGRALDTVATAIRDLGDARRAGDDSPGSNASEGEMRTAEKVSELFPLFQRLIKAEEQQQIALESLGEVVPQLRTLSCVAIRASGKKLFEGSFGNAYLQRLEECSGQLD